MAPMKPLPPSLWTRDPLPSDVFEDYRRLSGIEPSVPDLAEVVGSEVGKTILQQMGGAGRLKAMLGANFSFTPHGCIIQWPSRQRAKGNVVEIELKPSDTYEMRFFNVSTLGRKPVKTYNDVYAEDLIPIFEKQTGYYVRL